MSSKSGEKGIGVYLHRPWEFFSTLFLIVTWIVMGLHLELIGPTLLILSEQVQVNKTGISNILVTRSGGYLLANLLGALTTNQVKKLPELLLAIAFLLASIVVFITPSVTNVIVLCVFFLFQGISQGLTDLAGTSLLLSMWGDAVSAPLNAVHLGYGFGAVAANLLVMPFLTPQPKVTSSNGTTTLTTMMTRTMGEGEVQDQSNLYPPYRISSLICLLISFGHLLIFLRRRSRDRSRRSEEENERKETNYHPVKKEEEDRSLSPYSPRLFGRGSFSYGFILSLLWLLYMFFLSGNDQTFGKFFFAYLSSEEFHLSPMGATWGMIVYWLSYSIGRLICAIVTIFCPVDLALNVLWSLGFLLSLSWLLFVRWIGLTSEVLFILGGLTGLVFSPTFPLSFGFINQRLNVNPVLLGSLLCAGSIGAMAFQKLGGLVLDLDRHSFPILLVICVLVSIVLYIATSIVSSVHRRREQTKKTIERANLSSPSEEETQIESYLNNQD